jgi:hypothetical protein
MSKVSSFIIGMLVVSFVVATFALFMADNSVEYGTSYDNNTFSEYENLQELTELTEEIHNKQKDIKEKTGVLDVIGGYFSSAYDALRITGKSINTFSDVADKGIDDANIGVTGSNLKTLVISIVIIIIVIGVLLSAIMKWRL